MDNGQWEVRCDDLIVHVGYSSHSEDFIPGGSRINNEAVLHAFFREHYVCGLHLWNIYTERYQWHRRQFVPFPLPISHRSYASSLSGSPTWNWCPRPDLPTVECPPCGGALRWMLSFRESGVLGLPGESLPGPKHPDGSFARRSVPEIDIFKVQVSAHWAEN